MAVLESEDDLDGLAEALALAGLRFWLGDIPASHVVLERAIACARRSGYHRARLRASHWLAVTFAYLAIPADIAITALSGCLRIPAATRGPRLSCSSRCACCTHLSAAPSTPRAD